MLNTKWIGRAEWLVSIVLLLTVSALLIVRTTHAGPLWRDECGMVQLASLPRAADILENFQHEASPPLFAGVVRFYIALFGTSAAALRAFGLVVGTGIIAVAWLNSHRTCGGPPLLFLALIGLNVTFLVSGTSVRGYGLGSLLFLLTLGLAMNSFRSPAMLDVALTIVACIAALYCLANNVPLIAALGFSLLIAFLLRRRIRAALIVAVALGFIALLFLPVALRYFRSDWTVIIQGPIPLSLTAQKFSAALGAPFLFSAALWVLATGTFAVLSILQLRRPDERRGETDLLFSLVVFLGFSILAYGGFLFLLRYLTQSWYYLTFMCAFAGALDLIAGIAARTTTMRLVRLALPIAALLVMPFALWNSITQRATNMDLVVAKLQQDADVHDLILVNPWWTGVSFQWHYHGDTPWFTIPPIADLRFHRYDLVKQAMQAQDPVAEARQAMARTLQSANRVWIVGGARPPQAGLSLSIQPAPHPDFGWNERIYVAVWSMQLAQFLQQHTIYRELTLHPMPQVNPYENVPLMVCAGWQD
jgi:hypothetical protein